MSIKVRTEGFRELDQALEDLKRGAAKGAAQRAMTSALKPTAELAAQLAPDDPQTPAPDLKTSLRVSRRLDPSVRGGRPESRSVTQVYMGPNADGYPQAIFMEFGTKHHGPRPFMRPAWEQDQRAVLERLRVELRKEIDRALARARARAARAAARL